MRVNINNIVCIINNSQTFTYNNIINKTNNVYVIKELCKNNKGLFF